MCVFLRLFVAVDGCSSGVPLSSCCITHLRLSEPRWNGIEIIGCSYFVLQCSVHTEMKKWGERWKDANKEFPLEGPHVLHLFLKHSDCALLVR